FFVISGYCIAATADSSRRKSGASASYFRRRLRRILPPYWAALVFTAAVLGLVTLLGRPDLVMTDPAIDTGSIPRPAELTAAQWFGNLTLTETWRHYLFGDPELKLLGPSWTLCYEEQFYVVCGVLLLVAPRRFFAGVGVVSLFTLLMLGVTSVRDDLTV